MDDLHGRQLAVLLTFFCSFGGLVLFVAWAVRPNEIWSHPVAAAAIAGFACYPARSLVEGARWWRRLVGEGVQVVPAEGPGQRRALRRVRRLARVEVVKMILGVIGVLVALAIIPAALLVNSHEASLAGPVPAADVDRSIPWWAYLLVAAIGLFVGGLSVSLTFGNIRYVTAARRAFRRARGVVAAVTVVEIYPCRRPEDDLPTRLLLEEDDGHRWQLEVAAFAPYELKPGTRISMTGQFEEGGWTACLTSPLLLTSSRLSRSRPVDADAVANDNG